MCVRNYNSNPKNKDTITVDYMVIGGKQLLTGENKNSINSDEIKNLRDSLSTSEITNLMGWRRAA